MKDWERMYPDRSYLTGTGGGDDPETAEDRARAEIAKIFSSKIDWSHQIYDSSATGVDVSEILNVSSNMVMSGIRIAENWYDINYAPPYMALAVLDRQQSAEILSAQITQMDRRIRGFLDIAGKQTALLPRIRYLHAVLSDWALRQVYDQQLRIVNASGRGIAAALDSAGIIERLGMALGEYLIVVTVDGAGSDELSGMIGEELAKKGFSVTEDPAAAHAEIRGTCEISPLPATDVVDWKFVRWHVMFMIVDRDSGSIIGSVSETGKEAHLTTLMAEKRALLDIEKKAVPKIADQLSAFVFLPASE